MQMIIDIQKMLMTNPYKIYFLNIVFYKFSSIKNRNIIIIF